MSGWPSLDPREDRLLAEELAAGDATAPAQVFDVYAARLFDYCHALLRDQDAAAAALRGTLPAAFAHAGRLTEPHRLRAWLYALARNECLRRLNAVDAAGNRPPRGLVIDPSTGQARPPRQAPEVQNSFSSEGELAHRGDVRRLAHGALAGLGGRRREALDLLLRHALSPAELSGVLALGEAEATALAEDARARLDEALLVAIVMRSGRCPEVAALAEGAPWPPPQAVGRRLFRHLDEGCPVCAEQRERRVAAGRLLQEMPVPLMPPDLRGAVLGALTPGHEETLAFAAANAEPLDERGWPVPVAGSAHPVTTHRPRRRSGGRLLPALVAAFLVLVVVGAAFVLKPDGSGSPVAGGISVRPTASEPQSPSPSSADESPTPEEDSPSPSPTPSSPEATEATESETPSRRPSATPSRTTRPGTLAVSGCRMPAGERSCTIVISARGGTVRWSVSSANGVFTEGSGILSVGRTTGLTVVRPGRCTPGDSGSVSFSPNGVAAVTWACARDDAPTPDAPDATG